MILMSCASIKNKQINSNKDDIMSLFDIDFNEMNQKGFAAYQAGDYQAAVEAFLPIWKANRENAIMTWNIACMYGNLGEAELAGKFLLEAINNGAVTSIDQVENTRHFDNVKENPLYLEYYEQIEVFFTEQEKERGFISYLEAPAKMRYRTVLPEDFDEEKEYSILIFMHGFGGNQFNFLRYSSLVADRNIIFIMPQAPYTFENSPYKEPNFSWSIFDFDEENEETKSWELSGKFIVELANSLRKIYNTKAIYLSGFSQGANMTLNTGVVNNEVFDGLICFGGWLSFDSDYTPPMTRSIPVLIVHGTSDATISVDMGVDAHDKLLERGYQVEMQTFDGPHTIPKEEFEKALDWMIKDNK